MVIYAALDEMIHEWNSAGLLVNFGLRQHTPDEGERSALSHPEQKAHNDIVMA